MPSCRRSRRKSGPAPFGPSRKFLTHGIAGAVFGGFQITGQLSRISGGPFTVNPATRAVSIRVFTEQRAPKPFSPNENGLLGSSQRYDMLETALVGNLTVTVGGGTFGYITSFAISNNASPTRTVQFSGRFNF